MARTTAGADGARGRGCLSRAIGMLLGLVLLAAGIALFLWPSVSAWMVQQEMSSRIDVALLRGPDAAVDPETGLGAKEGDPAYEYLVAYNASVAAGTAGTINDPFGIGSDEQEMSALGLESSIVGSVTVPAMNVRIPIYLGATDEHMELGAAVISGTSAPLGGEGSNCVLAAHRGAWGGVPMFRDIESVKVGDLVVVETPWDVLVYRAAELRVISPTDERSVSVQPGRDLVTLFTCHPYGNNTQRYLVICERDHKAERDFLSGDGEVRDEVMGATTPLSILTSDVMRVTEPCESPELQAERVLRVVGLVLMLLVLVVMLRALVRAITRGGRRKPAPMVEQGTSREATAGTGRRARGRGAHFKE